MRYCSDITIAIENSLLPSLNQLDFYLLLVQSTTSDRTPLRPPCIHEEEYENVHLVVDVCTCPDSRSGVICELSQQWNLWSSSSAKSFLGRWPICVWRDGQWDHPGEADVRGAAYSSPRRETPLPLGICAWWHGFRSSMLGLMLNAIFPALPLQCMYILIVAQLSNGSTSQMETEAGRHIFSIKVMKYLSLTSPAWVAQLLGRYRHYSLA